MAVRLQARPNSLTRLKPVEIQSIKFFNLCETERQAETELTEIEFD